MVRQAPFTTAFLVVLWAVGAATGSVLSGPAPALARLVGTGVPALWHGHWWTPVTSLLWCDDLTGYLATTAILLALCAPAERRLGPARTLLTFVSTHVAGVLAAVGLVMLGARASDWCARDLSVAVAVGPSTAAMGVALAFTARCSPLWRRRLRLVLLVTLCMLALYSGALQDVLRLLAGATGLLLGPYLAGGGTRPHPEPPSRPELRLLLALVTAASAVGPLIAAVSGTARGPLFLLQYVLLPADRQIGRLAEACADPHRQAACLVIDAQLHTGRLSPAVLSLIPVLLLLVLAEGLRRGRRFALVLTIAVNLTLTAFGMAAIRAVPIAGTGADAFGQVFATSVAAVQPLLVAVVLAVCHRTFTVAAPRRTYRRLALLTTAALAALSALYVVLGCLVGDQFAGRPRVQQLLADLPMRFVPPGYVGVDAATVVPVGPVAVALHQWTGVLFWALVLGGALSTFWRSRVAPERTGAARARDLLRRYGGSELSYMTTWRGNQYWFSADGRVVVTYRLVGAVALTVGDPVGDPAAVPGAALDFARFCVAHSWTPCFYSVGDPLGTTLRTAGRKLAQVAEETRLALAGLSFTGRRWQDVRTAVNRAKRTGITAQWHTYSSSPAEVSRQIRAISAEWVVDKGMPEMGFTLGGLAELSDDEVRCLLAVDADGRVLAVTSWMPVYRDGSVVGWTLDLMRRRRDADNGLMEFLIATAAVQFQHEGAAFLSLSGAPLARLDRGQPATRLQRALDRVGLALEPVYGFRSLLAFKSKFQPEYRPLYMAYPEAVALPAIGGAVARAYLPDLTVPQGLRLACRALRQRHGAGAPEPRRAQPSREVVPARVPVMSASNGGAGSTP